MSWGRKRLRTGAIEVLFRLILVLESPLNQEINGRIEFGRRMKVWDVWPKNKVLGLRRTRGSPLWTGGGNLGKGVRLERHEVCCLPGPRSNPWEVSHKTSSKRGRWHGGKIGPVLKELVPHLKRVVRKGEWVFGDIGKVWRRGFGQKEKEIECSWDYWLLTEEGKYATKG